MNNPKLIERISETIMNSFIKKWYSNEYTLPCSISHFNGVNAWKEEAMLVSDILISDLKPILTHLEFVEGKQIASWVKQGDKGVMGKYVTWNDGEYEISAATKKLRKLIGEEDGR